MNGNFAGYVNVNSGSGFYNIIIGGSYGDMSSAGHGNAIIGGQYNTVSTSGREVTIIGGQQNEITGTKEHCVAMGFMADPPMDGSLALGSGAFSTAGDSQSGLATLQQQTTDATQTEMWYNAPSGSADADNTLNLPNDSSMAFDILVVARRTDADDESAAYRIEGLIDRNATAASTSQVSISRTVIGEDNAAWDAVAQADTTRGGLTVKVTGEAGKTINWHANVRYSMVTG